MNHAFIYELFDPRQPEVPRVVGKTIMSLEARLSGYIFIAKYRQARGRLLVPSAAWVIQLLNEGVLPHIRMIEKCLFTEWQNRERFWIATYRARGLQLLNVHAGGNGRSLPGTPESKICKLHEIPVRKWWSHDGLYCPHPDCRERVMEVLREPSPSRSVRRDSKGLPLYATGHPKYFA